MCVFACVWAVVFFGMVPIVQKKTKCLNSQQRGGETDRRGEKQTKKQTKRARQRESDFCPGNLAVYRPRTVYRDDLNHVDCLLPVWCHLLTSAWIGWLRELPCVCLSTLAVQTFLSCTAGTDRQTDTSPSSYEWHNIQPINEHPASQGEEQRHWRANVEPPLSCDLVGSQKVWFTLCPLQRYPTKYLSLGNWPEIQSAYVYFTICWPAHPSARH